MLAECFSERCSWARSSRSLLPLKSYEAADAIMHVPTAGIEVARAQAELGLLLEARVTLTRMSRIPPKPGELAALTAARKLVEQLNVDLATTRIPSITVVLTNREPVQPAQLVFDGEPVPAAAAQAPRKVNPGRHIIVVRSGSIERKQDVTVAAKLTLTSDVGPTWLGAHGTF